MAFWQQEELYGERIIIPKNLQMQVNFGSVIRKVLVETGCHQWMLGKSSVSFRPFSSLEDKIQSFSALKRKQVVLVDSDILWQKSIQELKMTPVIGFDTESKPRIGKMDETQIAHYQTSPHLIQLSTEDKVFLFSTIDYTDKAKIRERLGSILENEKIVKVGFDVLPDRILLKKNYKLHICNVVDLSRRLSKYPEQVVGLVDAVQVYLKVADFEKPKNITLSNWAVPLSEYSEEMILYAANDAYMALKVYGSYRNGGKVQLCIPRLELMHEKWLVQKQLNKEMRDQKQKEAAASRWEPFPQKHGKQVRPIRQKKVVFGLDKYDVKNILFVDSIPSNVSSSSEVQRRDAE